MDPSPSEPREQVVQAGELRSARIESLRAIAALAVMCSHLYAAANLWGTAAPEGLVTDLIYGGQFGVFLFFSLSGYLLFWPFAKRDFGGAGPVDLRRYAINRALRILPLYYVSVIVVLLVQQDRGTLREWVMFLGFAQNYSLDTVSSVNPVLWSLVVEVHFYLLLPLLAVALARLSGGSLARAALLLGAVGLASVAVRHLKVPAEPNTELLWRFSLPATFFFFVAGMLIALLRVAWERRPPRAPSVLMSADVWLLASVPLWVAQALNHEMFWLAALASALMVGACTLPLRSGRVVRALGWRALAAVGVVSYSLYVWHVPILQEIVGPIGRPRRAYSDVPFMVLLIPVCLAAAFVSYRLVEAPFLRLRRRWSSASAAQR